eukprot:jgi/Mesen1/4346/ME000022S03642
MLPGQGTIASIAFRLVGPAKGLTPTYYLNHGMPCSPSEHLITLTDAASDAVGTNFRSRDDKQTSAYTSVGKGFLEHLPYAFMGINRRCMHSTSPSNQKWHGKWKATSYSRMDAESSRKKHADYMKRQRRAEANRMLRKWRSMELDADDQATVSRCSSRTRAAFPGSNEPRLSQVSGHEVPRRQASFPVEMLKSTQVMQAPIHVPTLTGTRRPPRSNMAISVLAGMLPAGRTTGKQVPQATVAHLAHKEMAAPEKVP